jgi:hypothetical protein
MRLTDEPPDNMPYPAQEEQRRTLWSIYLLDKMATCGRARPYLLQDQMCRLQLPCSETSFSMSIQEPTITLESLKNPDECTIRRLSPFALRVALASILSQVASLSFLKSEISRPPWTYNSHYQSVLSRLARFEPTLESLHNITPNDTLYVLQLYNGLTYPTQSNVFHQVLFHLCHCLLQHPFLLRRHVNSYGARSPNGFYDKAFKNSWYHAQKLTQTLFEASSAGYNMSATMLSYSSLVAGTIHSLFQHSKDPEIRKKSVDGLAKNLAHLEEKARYWKYTKSMVLSCLSNHVGLF